VSNRVDQLATIRRLDTMFERSRFEYWLFGGWAVDFHAGAVTRDHADVDIAIWQADSAAVHELLTADDWIRAPSSEEGGYTTYSRNAVHVDLALLARDGDSIYTPAGSERGEWPAGSFGEDVRHLAGTNARVVSAASLLADKAQPREDPVAAAKDAADVAVLRSIAM
jgi:hypothetical protein